MLLWKKYLKQIEKIIGKTTHVSWRSKRTGWHDSWAMEMSGKTDGKTEHGDESAGKTSYSSRWSQGDLFYKMFLNDSCLGKACYEKCKYKALSSSADIRAGDFWGASYRHDDKGVSCVLVFTEKGLQIIKAIENSVMLIPQKTTVVLEGQMKSPPVKPRTYQLINLLLKSKLKLNTICKLCWFVYKIRSATNRKH
jgi:hypothetical protein